MAPSDSLHELIGEYFAAGKLLQLATVSGSMPWLTHVWYALAPRQSGFQLVFTSNKSRRHSGEIRQSNRVAAGVVAIELEGLGQVVRGLSLEGTCVQATGPEVQVAYDAYASRWPQVQEMFTARDVLTDATNMRMYVLDVERAVLFDELNFPEQPRREWRP